MEQSYRNKLMNYRRLIRNIRILETEVAKKNEEVNNKKADTTESN